MRSTKTVEQLCALKRMLAAAGVTVKTGPTPDMYTPPTIQLLPAANRRKRNAAALSEREQDVLELLRQGKTRLEIGAVLHISCRTVEKHIENIYQKLDVHCRSALLSPEDGCEPL